MTEPRKYTDLTISRMPEGGFLVTENVMTTGYSQMLFAASEIEEALAYIQEKLTAPEGN